MDKSEHIIISAYKALSLMGSEITKKSYDPYRIISCVKMTKRLLSDAGTVSGLSCDIMRILDRAQSLFFITDSVRRAYADKELRCINFFYSCRDIAADALGMFSALLKQGCDDTYILKRALLSAHIEGALHKATELRLYVMTYYGKIFRALPELEFICDCVGIAKKAESLCHAIDRVNNKFTLCT